MIDKKNNKIYNLPVMHNDREQGHISVNLKKISAISDVFDWKFIVFLDSGNEVECKTSIDYNVSKTEFNPNDLLYLLEQQRSRLFQAWAEMVNS